MMELSKETEEKINELQKLEQNMQSFLLQKQNFQSQLNEVTSALEEMEKTEKAYRIIGNIMVLQEKESLKKELQTKKEIIELRVKTMEKQEDKIKTKVDELQSQVMAEMNKK